MTQAAGLDADSRFIPHFAEMGRHSLGRNDWYYRRLPVLAAQLRADLVHLCCPMPLDASAFLCPTVVTLHDLYPCEIPMNFGFPKFLFNRFVLQQCLRSADAIACVSDATAARLRQYYPAASRKAVRIHNCVEAALAPEPETTTSPAVPIPRWNGEPFLLSVAQHRRNKNIPLLIRTFHRLLRSGQISSAARLVVVGIRGPETPHLDRLIDRYSLADRIHFLEGLSEAELQACYRHCEILLAPSITEGFGLPIAEGILAGCRIVASDIPAHREIGRAHGGDDRCTFVSLQGDTEESLAAAILAALRKPKPLPAPLPHLSAPVLAQQYVDLYRRLLLAPAKEPALAHSIAMTATGRQTL
jgi:glycosyltransferase involved in cell wall biosynthesis